MSWQKVVFILLILFCLTPLISPPIALATGLIVAFTFGNPFPERTKKITKNLLQISVVGLGFGMSFEKVVEAGSDGVLFTIATIFSTLAIGFYLGRVLKINDKVSSLISSGTAICGGSAIAAVAPVVEADAEEISVSLATIFVLNSIALFVFPLVGQAFDLTQNQFGVWSAIAIQDTSSVIGASARYGDEALQIATAVKLARALWIAPVALMFSFFYHRKNAKIRIPFFIFFFLLATIIKTYIPLPENVYELFVAVAKKGLTITLFLIGAGLSLAILGKVGVKPLLQGVVLWVLISVISLWTVLNLL